MFLSPGLSSPAQFQHLGSEPMKESALSFLFVCGGGEGGDCFSNKNNKSLESKFLGPGGVA